MRLALAIALGVTAAAAPAHEAPRVPVAVAVLFNTVCADCHELECSGRLAFCSGPEAARAHLERHAGALSAEQVGQLWSLIEYTKLHCRYVAPEAPGQPLSAFALPSRTAWFVPLGVLAGGPHRLRVAPAAPAALRVEVLTDQARLLDEDVDAAADAMPLAFEAAAGMPHFLRVRAARPVTLERVEVGPR